MFGKLQKRKLDENELSVAISSKQSNLIANEIDLLVDGNNSKKENIQPIKKAKFDTSSGIGVSKLYFMDT